MNLNVNKCVHLTIRWKTSPLTANYKIDNCVMHQNNCAKYFGVIITNKLNLWSENITNISNKAHSIIALLQKSLNQCQPSVKLTCYVTYIHPILEYASTVWSPHLACNINKLEITQWRSARFVFNDFRWTSSVTSMLNNLHWPILESTKQHAKLTMLYKILDNIISVPHDHLIRTVLPTCGHDCRFIQLASRTYSYLNSFFPSTVRLWNTQTS